MYFIKHVHWDYPTTFSCSRFCYHKQCRSHFASTSVAIVAWPSHNVPQSLQFLAAVISHHYYLFFCAFTEEGFQKPLDTLLLCPWSYVVCISLINSVVHVDAFWQSLQFSSCNITSLSYNQSSGRLLLIDITWDSMPVSHFSHLKFIAS